jgi:phytoene dehydrogenase-like protein
MDLDETAASLDAFAPGDGDAWRELYGLWRRTGRHLLDAMATPMPPLRPGARLARELGPSGLVRFARTMLLPVRRLGEERFRGEGGRRLLAGNALHTDLAPEASFSGFYGWFLAALGQEVGFPFPEGGAGRLTDALVRRLEERGGRVKTATRVTEVLVRRGRAVAVRTPAGDVDARRAVLADVDAPQLFIQLLAREHVQALNSRLIEGLDELRATTVTPRRPKRRGALICVKATDVETLVAALEREGIVTSSRDGNLRISAHAYNSSQDIDDLLAALARQRKLLA